MSAPPAPFGGGLLLDQVLVGGAASLLNLIIHASLLGAVVWAVRRLEARDTFAPAFLQYTFMIVSTGTLLVAVHFLEVLVWAISYGLAGAAPPSTDLSYLAFGNYTTLGYGEVRLVDGWRLLAPMTALNGIMLIGWSTALIIELLRRTGHAANQTLQSGAEAANSSS
jgi:Ion channel